MRWLRERCSLGHFVGQDFLLIRFIFMSEYERGPRGSAKFIFGAPMGPPMFKSPAHQGTWGPRATEIYTGPWVPEADGTKTRMPQAAGHKNLHRALGGLGHMKKLSSALARMPKKL